MDKGENTLLVGCLLRSKGLLASAVDKLGRYQLFDAVADPVNAYLWHVLSGCYKACGDVPTDLLFLSEVARRLNKATYDEGFKDRVKRTAHSLTGIAPENFRGAMGRVYLNTALASAIKVDWMARIKGMKSLDDVRNYMQETSTAMAGLTGDVSARSKPLLDLARHLKHKNRRPLGLRFWDIMLGGGVAEGEMIGVLGPSGGGKTVLSVSLACEKAKRREHVLLYSYEEPAEGDITERICTYLTGLSIKSFRDKDLAQLGPVALAAAEEAAERWGKYLTVVDLSRGDAGLGGPDEVITHMEQSMRENEGAGLIVIDWLGAMVTRYMGMHNLDPKQYGSVADKFLDAIGRYLRMHQSTSAVVFQQLRGEVAGASPAYEPTKNDGENWKSFPNKLDACYQLGVMDKTTNVAWFIGDKNRRAPKSKTMVRLDGEHQRFEEPKEKYEIDHRHMFVPVDNQQEAFAGRESAGDKYA